MFKAVVFHTEWMGKTLVAGLVSLLASLPVNAQGIGDFDDPIGGGSLMSRERLIEASIVANRSTFGMPYEGIVEIAKAGPTNWLEEQFNIQPTYLKPVAKDLITRQDAGEWPELVEEPFRLRNVIWRFAWWQSTMSGQDVVRQRVAYALSQFFVISDRVDNLRDNPYAITSFYDMLLDNAFTNYRDLLRSVALHPAMGNYLSHVNNAKADPENNIFPDQNFAREVMQLFSIGLFELNVDGTVKLDSDGFPIPTYDNDDIAEMSKIFTGLTYGGDNHYWGRWWFNHADERVFSDPMIMYEGYHEPGEKHLLNGLVVPAGQSGMADIEAAIDNLFHHPNTGPFFAKHLIQRLITSNPSPAYVERVARAFNGDQTGVRGDMKAVLRAILLDREAINIGLGDAFGRLREPAMRIISLARTFNFKSHDGTFYNKGYRLSGFVGQHPIDAPSVFNFYQPTHSPVGEIADRGLVAPEFQITTATTVIGVTNHVNTSVFRNEVFDLWNLPMFEVPRIDLSDYEELAKKPSKLMDRLDLVLTYGTLSDRSRTIIQNAIEKIDEPLDRAQYAIFFMLVSPDYAVED